MGPTTTPRQQALGLALRPRRGACRATVGRSPHPAALRAVRASPRPQCQPGGMKGPRQSNADCETEQRPRGGRRERVAFGGGQSNGSAALGTSASALASPTGRNHREDDRARRRRRPTDLDGKWRGSRHRCGVHAQGAPPNRRARQAPGPNAPDCKLRIGKRQGEGQGRAGDESLESATGARLRASHDLMTRESSAC